MPTASSPPAPRHLTHKLVDLITLASPNDDKLWEKMERLLKKGADPHKRGDFGEYPLEKLCDEHHHDAALKLLQEYPDLDVNCTRGDIRITPLMYALIDTHPALVRALCEHGADVNARSSSGASGVGVFNFLMGHIAGREQQGVECMQVLMQHGLVIDDAIRRLVYGSPSGAVLAPLVPGMEDVVAFKHAIDKMDASALQPLLAKGVSPDCGAEYGAIPPIIRAAAKGDAAIIGLLAAHGATPNPQRSISEPTALHEAAMGGHREAFLKLLDAGADTSALWAPTEKPAESVADAAARHSPAMQDFVKSILDARSNPDTPDVETRQAVKAVKTIKLKKPGAA